MEQAPLELPTWDQTFSHTLANVANQLSLSYNLIALYWHDILVNNTLPKHVYNNWLQNISA